MIRTSFTFEIHTDIFAVYCHGVYYIYNLGPPAEARSSSCHSVFLFFQCFSIVPYDLVVNLVAVGKRKPDPDFYMDVSKHLKVDPTSCIFIDDRWCFEFLKFVY